MTAATNSNNQTNKQKNEIASKEVDKCTMSSAKDNTDRSKNTSVSINTPQNSQSIYHTSNYENDEYGHFPITNSDIIDKLVEEREILRSSQKKEEKQQQSHNAVDINNDDDYNNEDNHEENNLLNHVAESIVSDTKKENNNKKAEKAEQTQKIQQRNSSKSSTSRSTSQSRATEHTSRQLCSNSRSNSPMISKHLKEHTFFCQSNTHVVSTFNKAGLSIIKHTKLKRSWPDSFMLATCNLPKRCKSSISWAYQAIW
jgi:hypothetical protein